MSSYTHVTPQWAGGFALELILGTVGTGASECAKCGAEGVGAVGVGAARPVRPPSVLRPVLSGPNVLPNAETGPCFI